MLSNIYSEFRFDYYRATFDDISVCGYSPPSWQDLVECMNTYFDSPFFEVDPHPVAKQALKGIKVLMLGRPFLRMCWGGSTFGDRVFIQAEGQNAQLVYNWLSSRYSGRYSCSRVDVCSDSIDKQSFDLTNKALTEFASRGIIKTRTAGDWLTGVDGRTLYVGAKRPGSFIRFYEKGKQLKSDVKEWCRLEFEISPSDKHGKRRLATLTPIEAANYIPFIAGFLQSQGWSFTVDKGFPVRVWKASDFQQSLVHGVTQYKRHLRTLADSLPNGFDDIGGVIREILEIHDEKGIINGSIAVEDSPLYGLPLNPYSEVFDKYLGEVSNG